MGGWQVGGGGANKVDAGAKSPEKLWQASMSAGDCIRGLNLETQDSFFCFNFSQMTRETMDDLNGRYATLHCDVSASG